MIVPIVREPEWKSLLNGLPEWQPPQSPVLVLTPHPDDETLAAGGLIASLRSRNIDVTIVAVTDGENAYPNAPHLAELREREQTEALGHLGVAANAIHRLHLPDSSVAAHEQSLTEHLLPLVTPDTHILAPWPHDFHPDHEACGRAAATVAKRKHLPLTYWFFWTWHRGTPNLLHKLPLVAFPLTEQQLRAKRDALACHRSQLHHESGDPVLPENLLAPARRPFEVFLPA